jgi:hypothetical protein
VVSVLYLRYSFVPSTGYTWSGPSLGPSLPGWHFHMSRSDRPIHPPRASWSMTDVGTADSLSGYVDLYSISNDPVEAATTHYLVVTSGSGRFAGATGLGLFGCVPGPFATYDPTVPSVCRLQVDVST